MDKKAKKPEEELKKKAASGIKNSDVSPNLPDKSSQSGEADKSNANPVVRDEVIGLLGNDDIESAIKRYKVDSADKETARDFINSHIQFLLQIIENDYRRGIARSDAEIRDLLSNVNMMLMKKDAYLFNTMVMHCPSHYRSIQRRFYEKTKKDEDIKLKE